MKKIQRIFISRSNDHSGGGGGGFGFTLRHLVVYPPSISFNDILQASYSVVIDEHQQKQLDDVNGRISRIHPSSSTSFLHHQGEQQGLSSSNSLKIIDNDHIEGNGQSSNENPLLPPQSMDTIYVKEVRPDSPAYKSGLRPGDRILSVNDQSIQGKSYSQVIAIIQNTPTDLILNVIPNEDDITSSSLNSFQSIGSINRSSMSNNTIEQKLRNLQINLAQGRTQEELAKAGIYFPPPTSSSSAPTGNIFSNYIDSVHKALDSNKQTSTSKGDTSSPYHNKYVPYEYQQATSTDPTKTTTSTFNSSYTPSSFTEEQTQPWTSPASSRDEEVKSPSTDSFTTEKDMKTEFVNFRKKQFETGHVENLVHDTQRESKTKKYSEKKKYENEWNRLTAVADVESVMERASHFEDIDPDKFARLKSKLPNSPPPQENFAIQEDFSHEMSPPHQMIFYDAQPQFKMLKSFDSPANFSIPRAGEINTIEYNYNPRYLIDPIRTNQSHYTPMTRKDNQRYTVENYSSPRPAGVNLIRQDSYITAVRSTHPNDQSEDFAHLHACDHFRFSFNPETPILRRKASQYGITPEQEMKQRRTSYLIATDQRIPNRANYVPADFSRTNKNENYSYDLQQGQQQQTAPPPLPQQQQKLRNTPQNQTQAIKKLKNFFGEGTPEVTHALDHRSTTMPSLSSSDNPSKSNSYYENSPTNPSTSIPLTTMADNLEASKEGILYCKMVLKEGRRAIDRSWRGAWAVLRRGALFLGKEKKHGLLIPLSCDSFPINLQHAEVELASDYVKKPRVFKLTTANQSEFLFQAPDLQSLAEWLDVIHEHCSLTSTDVNHPSMMIINKKEISQRKSTTSLPPIAPGHRSNNQQDLIDENVDQRKLNPSNEEKNKTSVRSPSLKRSPSLRFRKSQKSSITQPTQVLSSVSGLNSPSNVSPRRSFVKSIVKKGLRTLKSSSSILTSQMSGQIYDESSGESLSSAPGVTGQLTQGINFGIELEECECSSISRYVPIVVEILTRLVELRGINYQGIYRHAGGLTAVNWLVNELDKGSERIEFNSERWYDVKAVASTLKTFFAKLPDSLLSSKMSSLCVEASRIENHCDRVVELKRLVVQLDDYRFETLKYLCAHFRRVASKCDINKIDARNLAIIFGPTLIWDSRASLQSNLVDNPEKIRIIESFILYYEWFFDHNDYDGIPVEINPQMPKLPPVPSVNYPEPELIVNNETKPSEIIQQIVRAAKRRWSSPLLLDSLSSLSTTTTDQQTSKPINISVKRNRRRDKKDEKSSRSRSVDSSLHDKQISNNPIVTSSTDSAVYSMSDISSSISTQQQQQKKPSQSLKDISHFFQYFTLSNDKYKSKTLTNIRRKKSRKKLTNETFLLPTDQDDEIYEKISNSSICFIDQSPVHQMDFIEQTSRLKSKLTEHEQILQTLKKQINQVDQQLFFIEENSKRDIHRQFLKRRHTFNSLFDLNCLLIEKEKHLSSSSSLYALQLL